MFLVVSFWVSKWTWILDLSCFSGPTQQGVGTLAPNDLTPCRMAFYFVSTFAIAQTPTKQPALRLSRTKNPAGDVIFTFDPHTDMQLNNKKLNLKLLATESYWDVLFDFDNAFKRFSAVAGNKWQKCLPPPIFDSA
jgi:hypothetical protein